MRMRTSSKLKEIPLPVLFMAVGGEGGPPSWLLLRHFPGWLTSEDKQSLLTHFGATEVVVMATKGIMRNCVFAAFSTRLDAMQAMGKLHQLDVFGNKLIVEYTHDHNKLMQGAKRDKWSCNNTPWKEPEIEEGSTDEKKILKASPLPPPPPPPPLPSPKPAANPPRYLYPLASHSILTNITSALMCVPEFYQQVLHLMNKMNLPPPFGALTPAPPLFIPPETQSLEEGDDEDKEGSEIESDEEERMKMMKKRKIAAPIHTAKRHKVSYTQVKSLKTSLNKATREESEAPILPSSRLKIELKVPSVLTPQAEGSEQSHTVTYIEPISSRKKTPPPTEEEETEPDESSMPTEAKICDFISLSEINSSKLSKQEMEGSHVYKKYSPGEPSTRLYVKNLAKQVEEEDLRYIFGRYVNWSVEEQSNMFDIRLMQTGRMKGQAFIGLPSEAEAARALEETNGYILHSKPIVVHFARSTKPKSREC